APSWRIEIVSNNAIDHKILTILQPSLHTFKESPPTYKKIAGGVAAILNDNLIAMVGGQEPVRIQLTNDIENVYIVGLNKDQTYQLIMHDKIEIISARSSIEFKLSKGTDYLELRLINK
ncbi:hypothetical protein MJH12_13965, partial [bacterium]|nr:hypothetical protein [bacterium]